MHNGYTPGGGAVIINDAGEPFGAEFIQNRTDIYYFSNKYILGYIRVH